MGPLLYSLLLLLLLLPSALLAAPTVDLITQQLPGLKETPNFRQFAGYLDIGETKQLYYWYVESQGDPKSDPVLLWLNGGPGCSSLQGLLLELGPFRVADHGATVTINPLSWNRYASIIFLDTPAGVGFSLRGDGRANYTDDEVAADNKRALTAWFEEFPERRANDFYIAGESYAGTYIPMLAKLLADDPEKFPTFKGMFVGNGCVNDKLLFNSGIQYAYYHGLIDETMYSNAFKKCCAGTSAAECDFYSMSLDKTNPCHETANNLDMAKYDARLDPYFLYFTCYLDEAPVGADFSAPSSVSSSQRETMLKHVHRHNPNFSKKHIVSAAEPACSHHNDFVEWLAREDVRLALHVPATVPPYQSCSQAIEDQYITQYTDMSDFVKYVVKKKKKVMFFNGDVDSICNVAHNSQFFAQLGLPLLAAAVPWTNAKEKPATAGMLTRYEGLDFLTVRGAGHFSSSDNEKPRESLQMFYNFVNGRNYSESLPAVERSTSDSTMTGTTTISAQATTSAAVVNGASVIALLVAFIHRIVTCV